MEIDAQTVIDSLTTKFATRDANNQKDIVVMEAQINALNRRVAELESENQNLSAELANRYSDNSPIEGEVIG